ncbi:caprin-2-like [Ostrea edulis]|uniref:caprin-2-like n=1 Tax=Ostrea edulis TaxID=37623 RepID=UPI0024AEF484|nr:caprin-2-like [Ostrea edulis]
MGCKLLSVFLLVFMFDKISTFPEEHQIKADGRLEGMFNTLSQEVTSLKKLWANDVTRIKGQITRLEKQMYLLQESTVSGFTQRHRRAAHLPSRSSVHFSAGIRAESHYGVSDGAALIFQHVTANTGNAYDPNLGIFTAPTNGTYVFFSTILSANTYNVWVDIVKNGVSQVREGAHGSMNTLYPSASNVVILDLFQGDKVWVRSGTTGALYTHEDSSLSTFSGFML